MWYLSVWMDYVNLLKKRKDYLGFYRIFFFNFNNVELFGLLYS